MNILDAHDTSANIINSLTEEVSRKQNRTFPYLLIYWIRKLDIGVALFDSIEEDKDLHICHGKLDCYYIDEYKLIFKFLEENPSETIIFRTQS